MFLVISNTWLKKLLKLVFSNKSLVFSLKSFVWLIVWTNSCKLVFLSLKPKYLLKISKFLNVSGLI
ncbi:hypothetical protein NWE59_02520 [Mycoplasmopsis felis]|uniref:hypothetical protein n=1 Tax=Mycoplasmopsis felis TaxID=33923 RepID=UPI0021AF64C5|nr:hypothetical protein [Mycoplasmopsis felis]UWV78923.1 hypothetical protein NWE59_02520 [Mycoplasmopsis felis]